MADDLKKGKAYPEEAIELCRKLYCKYGGNNHDLIEREMRKAGWAKWSKMNLQNRGREGTRSERMGWIARYGFERSLKLHIEKLAEKVNDDEQGLYIDIKAVRKRLGQRALGENADKDDLAKYRDFCKLEIEARRNLNLTRDNFETFVSGYEKLLTWASDIDPQLAKLLAKCTDKFAELAQAHYGKDEVDDGAELRTDESGGEPFSLIARGD